MKKWNSSMTARPMAIAMRASGGHHEGADPHPAHGEDRGKLEDVASPDEHGEILQDDRQRDRRKHDEDRVCLGIHESPDDALLYQQARRCT